MTTALVRIRDCASRRDPPFICPETALHVYSLAREYGLHKETLEAAEETLKFPMTIQDLEDKLGIVPSVVLYELWQNRQRILVDLKGSLKSFESEAYQIFSGTYLDCVEIDEDSEVPMWINQYLDSVLEDTACVDLTTFHLALSSHVSIMGEDCCECCSSISRETIGEFWTALTTAVRESTRKVGHHTESESDKSQLVHRLHRTSHSQKGKSIFRASPPQHQRPHLCSKASVCKERMLSFDRLTLFPSASTSRSWPYRLHFSKICFLSLNHLMAWSSMVFPLYMYPKTRKS